MRAVLYHWSTGHHRSVSRSGRRGRRDRGYGVYQRRKEDLGVIDIGILIAAGRPSRTSIRVRHNTRELIPQAAEQCTSGTVNATK